MTIEIENVSYYLKCNQYALEVFTEKLDLSRSNSITAVYATIWALIQGGAYVRGEEEVEITFEQLVDWVDKNEGSEEIKKAAEYWAESFVYQKWIDRVLGEDGEKKTIKKKTGTKSIR